MIPLETVVQQPGKMRPDALGEAKGRLVLCECGCGRSFVKTRKWHRFYSAECRKRYFQKDREPADIRATLARIESKVDQIISGGTK